MLVTIDSRFSIFHGQTGHVMPSHLGWQNISRVLLRDHTALFRETELNQVSLAPFLVAAYFIIISLCLSLIPATHPSTAKCMAILMFVYGAYLMLKNCGRIAR